MTCVSVSSAEVTSRNINRSIRVDEPKIRCDPLAVEIAILDFVTSRIGLWRGKLGDAVDDAARIAAAKHDRSGAPQYIYPLKGIWVGYKSTEIKPVAC